MKSIAIVLTIISLLPFNVLLPQKTKNINDDKYQTHYCFITKREFTISPNNSAKISKKDSLVKQNGSYTLSFHNKTLVLQDIENEDSPEYKKYVYLGDVENFWFFNIYGYEMSTTFIVNKIDGDCQEIFGAPLISPNGYYICNASQTVNYEPFQNLLQIWSIRNKQFKLIYQLDISNNWIPYNIKWIDDNTILFMQKGEKIIEHYSKIKVKRIK